MLVWEGGPRQRFLNDVVLQGRHGRVRHWGNGFRDYRPIALSYFWVGRRLASGLLRFLAHRLVCPVKAATWTPCSSPAAGVFCVAKAFMYAMLAIAQSAMRQLKQGEHCELLLEQAQVCEAVQHSKASLTAKFNAMLVGKF